jgi:hypothetical protein
LKGQNGRYRVTLQKELGEIEIKEEECLLNSASLDKKTFIQAQLLRLAEEEEMYWHKRSNEN